jgi:hypothetical protein
MDHSRQLSIEHVQDWDNLHKVLNESFCGARWVFRGQRDARWDLRTSFERVCAGIDSSRWHLAELHLLHQFQRRLHQYEKVIPDADDILEWWALMQHYGAPTRLLDWTRSPYVAAYFALESASPNCPAALWVLDRQALHNHSLDRWPNLLETILSTPTGSFGDKTTFSQLLRLKPSRAVFAIEPFRMNDRLTVQQGLFLMPVTIEAGFDVNLSDSICSDHFPCQKAARIDLAFGANQRLIALEELRRMNIHRSSLFPGIDGFAQSLATEIEIWGSFDGNRILIDGNYNELF